MDSFYAEKRRFTRQDVADLLRGRKALFELAPDEALAVVQSMKPRRLRKGTVLTQQGLRRAGQMLLILQGEASVESETVRRGESMLLAVLGAGDLVGEVGLFDGEPRSATCTAVTDMDVAMLDQEQLAQLIQEQPAVAAKLLSVILQRVSEKLRATNHKLKTMAMINRSLTEELADVEQRLRHAAGGTAAAQTPAPEPGPAPGFEATRFIPPPAAVTAAASGGPRASGLRASAPAWDPLPGFEPTQPMPVHLRQNGADRPGPETAQETADLLAPFIISRPDR